MVSAIIDSRLAQTTMLFCKKKKRPSRTQLSRMRDVIAKDFMRSISPNLGKCTPSPAVDASKRASRVATPQEIWSRACDRHLLPDVCIPHELVIIPGAQRVGKQRGAGECGQLCVRKFTAINFDAVCEPGEEHFESWTHQAHKLKGWPDKREPLGATPQRGGIKRSLARDNRRIAAQFGMHATVGRAQPSRVLMSMY